MRILNKAQMDELKTVLASLEIHTLTVVHRYVTGLYQVANKSTQYKEKRNATKSNST